MRNPGSRLPFAKKYNAITIGSGRCGAPRERDECRARISSKIEIQPTPYTYTDAREIYAKDGRCK